MIVGPERHPRPEHNSRLSSTVVNGGLWLGASAVVQTILQIVIFAILARLLTPSEFGLVAVANIVTDFVTGLATMGVSQALVQKKNLTPIIVRAAFTSSLLVGALSTGAVYLLSWPIAGLMNAPGVTPLIQALSVTFFIRSLSLVPLGLASRGKKFKLLGLRQVVSYTIGYGIVGVFAAYRGCGAWSLIFAQVSQASVITILMFSSVRFESRFTLDRAAHKAIAGFGSGYSFARILNSLANQADRMVVGVFLPLPLVGVYSRALQIARYPALIFGQVIEDVLFPSFSGIQGETGRLGEAYTKAIGSISIIMTPISVFVILASQQICAVLLGAAWGDAPQIVAIMAAVLIFRSAQRVTSAVLRALGRSWLVAALQALFFVLTATGSMIGVRYGLLGVSVAVTGAVVCQYVASLYLCGKYIDIVFVKLLRTHLAAAPLSMVTAICIVAVEILLSEARPEVQLAVMAITVILSAIIVVIILPRVFLQLDGIWLFGTLYNRLPYSVRKNSFLTLISARILN